MSLQFARDIQELLRDFIQANQELNRLLEQDINFYKANELESIIKSNQAKEKLQQEIEVLLLKLNAHSALPYEDINNPFDKIRRFSKSLPADSGLTILELLEEAESLCQVGYQLVLRNAEIVEANLNYGKELINKIVGLADRSSVSNQTYDKSANIHA